MRQVSTFTASPEKFCFAAEAHFLRGTSHIDKVPSPYHVIFLHIPQFKKKNRYFVNDTFFYRYYTRDPIGRFKLSIFAYWFFFSVSPITSIQASALWLLRGSPHHVTLPLTQWDSVGRCCGGGWPSSQNSEAPTYTVTHFNL